MYLTKDMWPVLEAYLTIDKKLDNSYRNVLGHKSRYFLLCKFFSDLEFNRQNFNAFILQMQQKNLSISYQNNMIKIAKHIDKCFGINQLADYTYFKDKKYTFVDTFTAEEMKEIANYMYPYNNRHGKTPEEINLKYKTIYLFMSFTACRISELLNLKWVDFFPDYCVFRDTKNGDERAVPIPDFVCELMRKLPQTSELVFDCSDYTTINKDIKQRCKALGIDKPKLSNHIFRHSTITLLLKSGAPISAVQALVGHRDIQSTQRYTHMLLTDQRMAQNFHPLFKEQARIEFVGKKIREFAENLIDSERFAISTSMGSGFDLKIVPR